MASSLERGAIGQGALMIVLAFRLLASGPAASLALVRSGESFERMQICLPSDAFEVWRQHAAAAADGSLH